MSEKPNPELPAWKKKLPNQLTYLRIAMVPPIVVLLHWNESWAGYASAIIFIIASVTDYWDGELARRFGVVSNQGKFLDPVADKILVSSTLVMLIPSGRLDAIIVVILLARDSLISALRSVAAAEKMIIPAGTLGKWKTATQMIAIPAILVYEPVFGVPVFKVGYWILWVSVALSVISGAKYVWDYYRA